MMMTGLVIFVTMNVQSGSVRFPTTAGVSYSPVSEQSENPEHDPCPCSSAVPQAGNLAKPILKGSFGGEAW
jgi:hypothetical protein